jgi:hypothetical protein
MPRVNIEINEEIHKKAKINALLLNKTLTDFIIESIEEKNRSLEKKR